MTATDAPRLAAHKGVLVGDFRGDDMAGGHAAGAEDVLHHVQSLDHLGAALADDLAALVGHQPGEGIGLAFDDLGEVVEQFGAVDAAGAAPGREGGPGGGDGLLGVSGGAPGEDAQHLVETSGVAALEVAAGGGLPVAGDEMAAGYGRRGGGRAHDLSPFNLPRFPGSRRLVYPP